MTGQIGAEYADDQVAAIAEQWATALGLTRVDQPVPGTIEYRGPIDDMQVSIWGVIDRPTMYNLDSAEGAP